MDSRTVALKKNGRCRQTVRDDLPLTNARDSPINRLFFLKLTFSNFFAYFRSFNSATSRDCHLDHNTVD